MVKKQTGDPPLKVAQKRTYVVHRKERAETLIVGFCGVSKDTMALSPRVFWGPDGHNNPKSSETPICIGIPNLIHTSTVGRRGHSGLFVATKVTSY